MPPQLINIALKLNKFVMSIVAIFGKVLSNMILSVGVIPGDFALRGFPSVPSPFRGLPCNSTPGPGCTFAFAFIQSGRQQVKLQERQDRGKPRHNVSFSEIAKVSQSYPPQSFAVWEGTGQNILKFIDSHFFQVCLWCNVRI